MEGILAIVFLFGGGTVALLSFSPVGRALAERIRGGPATPTPDPEVWEELDRLRGELAELHERVDFAERLLSKGPAAETPNPRPFAGGGAGEGRALMLRELQRMPPPMGGPPDWVGVVAIVSVLVGAVLLWPLVRALARRLEGRRPHEDAIRGEVDGLHDRVAELEGLAARIQELENRVEFSERLLARHHDPAPGLRGVGAAESEQPEERA